MNFFVGCSSSDTRSMKKTTVIIPGNYIKETKNKIYSIWIHFRKLWGVYRSSFSLLFFYFIFVRLAWLPRFRQLARIFKNHCVNLSPLCALMLYEVTKLWHPPATPTFPSTINSNSTLIQSQMTKNSQKSFSSRTMVNPRTAEGEWE